MKKKNPALVRRDHKPKCRGRWTAPQIGKVCPRQKGRFWIGGKRRRKAEGQVVQRRKKVQAAFEKRITGNGKGLIMDRGEGGKKAEL